MNIKNLEPKRVFEIFDEFSKIPHGSYNIDAISDWVVSFAQKHNLEYIQDDDKNVVVFKPATKGFENVDTLMIQGHLDMVCSKVNDSKFDFKKDPLDLYVDGDFLKANGTTLGADDGVAIAFALAILTDETLQAGPIEAIFTVNEEVGLLGAASISADMLKGKYMINIDSPEESSIVVSCAGGQDAEILIPINKIPCNHNSYKLIVDGLNGGHSGEHINSGLANANKILIEVLTEISKITELRIELISGGVADNVIPSYAEAVIQIKENELLNINSLLVHLNETLKKQYEQADKNINLRLIEFNESTNNVFDPETTDKLLSFVNTSPNGVVKMSRDIENLVETSLNLGIIKTEDKNISLIISMRSSVDSEKKKLFERLAAISLAHGAIMRDLGGYPGWDFNKESVLQDLCKNTYKELYNKDLRIEAIHAGLECGIFSGKIKNLDCISMGPDVFDIHTINERLSISSTQRSYEFLKNVIKRFALRN